MKQPLVWLPIGILIGLILFAGIRFATYKDEAVHYHANFALYVNGQREQFLEPGYYGEASGCGGSAGMSPAGRAHLHASANDVVHVEDEAVTWGQFFENLGWSVGKNHIATWDQLLSAGGSNKISFILNGQPVSDVAGRVIKNEDRLLVNYGTQSQPQLDEGYKSISHSAKEENESKDPASCGGSAPTGWRARWHHIFN